jgi:hypothetical protein
VEDTVTRTISTFLILALCSLLASAARAETRLTVHDFYGPEGNSLRGDVEAVLRRQQGLTLVPKHDVDNTARDLGVDAFSPEGRKIIARELKLSAWIMGVVKKSGGKLKLTVVMYDGAEHARIGRAVLAGRSTEVLRGAVKRELWQQSRNALAMALAPLPAGRGEFASDVPEGARAPTLPAPPGAAEEQNPTAAEGETTSTDSAAAPEVPFLYTPPPGTDNEKPPVHFPSQPDSMPEQSSRSKRPESLQMFVGVGSPYRSFTYSDPISPELGDYTLSGVPMFDLSLAYYPARAFTDGWASWLGLDTSAQLAIGSSSVDRDGNKYKSRYDAYRVGMRGRVPVSKHYISAFCGYAMSRFSTEAETEGVEAPTPDVDYRMIRSGAGTELRLPRAIVLGMDAAWLHMLSVGEIGAWFPRTTAGGVEFALFATYPLSQHFFARLTGSYVRHFFDFNSQPGDERVAGGATDQYLTASLSIGVGL